jgi:hypothetical protein
MRGTAGIVLLVAGAASLVSSTAWSEDDDAVECQWCGLTSKLSLESRLTHGYRSLGDDEDSDFYGHWFLRGREFFDGRLDLYSSGRVHRDLDGTGDSQASDLLLSVEDRNAGWEEQIYQVYGDLHDQDERFAVRVGRQYLSGADSLHVDGIELRAFERKLVSGRAFGGRPVSYYSGTSGDYAVGGSIEIRPLVNHRVRFSYVHNRDESAGQEDDRYVLDIWNRFSERIRTHERAAFLDERLQMASFDFSYLSLDGNFDAMLGVRHWAGLDDQTREYSPLHAVLGDLEPYTYLSARLNRVVHPMLIVSPGAAVRITQGSERDRSNRQYVNGDLTLIFEPFRHWALTLSGEYWDVSSGDRFWGLTGEIEYDSGRLLEVAVGTSYLDYRYGAISGHGYTFQNGDLAGLPDGRVTQKSPDVYSVYARVMLRVHEHAYLSVRGEIEDDSIEKGISGAARTTLVLRF